MGPEENGAAGRDLEPAATAMKEVVLQVLREILARYESGATELREEFDLPEITMELLMQVCLAAPDVEDLVLGFIRDDLKVISLSEQTWYIADRVIGLLERDSSRWMRGSDGSLGQSPSLRDRAEADARLAQSGSSELEDFILNNKAVHERILALKHSDLVRWVMLALLRETKARGRGGAVIATWSEKQGPELRKRLEAIRMKYNAPRQKLAALAGTSSRAKRLGSGIGGP